MWFVTFYYNLLSNIPFLSLGLGWGGWVYTCWLTTLIMSHCWWFMLLKPNSQKWTLTAYYAVNDNHNKKTDYKVSLKLSLCFTIADQSMALYGNFGHLYFNFLKNDLINNDIIWNYFCSSSNYCLFFTTATSLVSKLPAKTYWHSKINTSVGYFMLKPSYYTTMVFTMWMVIFMIMFSQLFHSILYSFH